MNKATHNKTNNSGRKRRGRLGPVQQKTLLLLLGGVALGLSGSPRQYFKIVRGINATWKDINEAQLRRSIRKLYKSKLVRSKPNRDGTTTLVLTKEGKERALKYNLEQMEIPTPSRWDQRWRLVTFDIPERLKNVRESMRIHLKQLGFVEFQKSIFIYPYPCEKEVEFIIEFYNIRKFVRLIIADSIDNELHFRHRFKLS